MMNLDLILEDLVPGADYSDYFKTGDRYAYDHLVWRDARPKPPWGDVVAQWALTEVRFERMKRADTLGDGEAEMLELLITAGSLPATSVAPEKLDAVNARRELRGEAPF